MANRTLVAFLAVALFSIFPAFSAKLGAQDDGASYIDRLVGRDFVLCKVTEKEDCASGSQIPIGFRETEPGKILMKTYGSEFMSLPTNDIVFQRQPDGSLTGMTDMISGRRQVQEGASRLEFANSGGLVSLFERAGHPVLQFANKAGDHVWFEANLMPPEQAKPELASKFAAMHRKYGTPVAAYDAVGDASTMLANFSSPGSPAAPVSWGYVSKMAGRDYVYCHYENPRDCGSTSYPALVRETPTGFVIDVGSYETAFTLDARNQPTVKKEGIGTYTLVAADKYETIIELGRYMEIYTEIAGRPALVSFVDGKYKGTIWFYDPGEMSKDWSKKLANRYDRYGAPTVTSPLIATGMTGPIARKLILGAEERQVALAKAEALAAQQRATAAASGGYDHGREARKGLGGVLGGVIGTLAGAHFSQGLGLTESIAATVASATAGALVGSGEISPEDALAATNAITSGVAQGYADAAAQNAQMAATMAQAKAADDRYRQAQTDAAQQAANAKAQSDRDAIARVFAEAEAYRATELARAKAAGDTARAQQIEAQSAAAMQTVHSFGLDEQVRESARRIAAANQAALPQQLVNTAARPQQPVTPYPNDSAAATTCVPMNVVDPPPCHNSSNPVPTGSGNVANKSGNGSSTGTPVPGGNRPDGRIGTGPTTGGPSWPSNPGGGTGSGSSLVTWMEGVAVCDQSETGRWRCRGPRDSSSFYSSLESNLKEVCKNARPLGSQGGYAIYGCGYGINPNESAPFREAHQFDWIKALNLTSPPGRMTFRCPASQTTTCRTR